MSACSNTEPLMHAAKIRHGRHFSFLLCFCDCRAEDRHTDTCRQPDRKTEKATERERESVCVCECMCMCVRAHVYVYVCVCVVCVCVCVCVVCVLSLIHI